MTSQPAVIELLIEKGRIEPQMAFAIADGIDLAVMQSQFVTVPILDARFAELRAEFRIALTELDKKIEVTAERTKAELVRWAFIAVVGNVVLNVGATALLNVLQHPH